MKTAEIGTETSACPTSVLTTTACSAPRSAARCITESLAERLYPYLAGIARENQFRAVEIGGIEDHIHILVSLPSTITIAKAMQLLKGGSSKWIHDTFPEHRTFSWQKKYGSFSVSISQLDTVIAYIRRQKEHHQKLTFQTEFVRLLKKHRIEYDERYLWE